jgi:hypothetical protein
VSGPGEPDSRLGYEFSTHALNLSSGEELKLAASRLGMDLNEIVNVGLEEEDDNDGEE